MRHAVPPPTLPPPPPLFLFLLQNGTGNISTVDLEEGLRQLKVFDGMSKEQASLATRRFDQNGDGVVGLSDFLAFAGKAYSANDRPLEAKLRRVLLKAESVRRGFGSRRRACFAALFGERASKRRRSF